MVAVAIPVLYKVSTPKVGVINWPRIVYCMTDDEYVLNRTMTAGEFFLLCPSWAQDRIQHWIEAILKLGVGKNEV